jgi:NADH dehydrogenase
MAIDRLDVAPRRVCVVGGSGFVGSELVPRLVAAGHHVRIPTRNPDRGSHLTTLPNVELVRADVCGSGGLPAVLEGMDAIINLIGIRNEAAGATFKKIHIDLTAKLLACACAAGVRRLLHMSALGADAVRGASKYMRSKGAAEELVRAASVDFTIFRPSMMFGARDRLTNRFARWLRLSRGIFPLVRPEARLMPIFAGDVATAFVKALSNPATIRATYELCGPEVLTLRQIVRITAESAHLPCFILPLPDPVARLEGFVLGLLPGKPFSLDNFRSLSRDSVSATNDCAVFGIEPRRLSDVLPTSLVSGRL